MGGDVSAGGGHLRVRELSPQALSGMCTGSFPLF